MSTDVFQKFVDSPLFAPVSKIPLVAMYEGEEVAMEDNSVIVYDGKPLCVVRDSYPLIETPIFLEQAENCFSEVMTPHQLASVQVMDSVKKDGAWMQRSYLFPAIGQQLKSVGGEQHVGYRCILTNSYNGRSSAMMATGLIDFYCTNGMIMGKDIDIVRTRHSTGFDVGAFMKRITASVNAVQTEIHQLQRMADTTLSKIELAEAFLKRAMGPKLGERIYEHFVQEEVPVRGATVWGVMSALTFYSSHNSTRFPVRGDNGSYRLHKREEEVRKVLSSSLWEAFKEAA